MALNDTGRPVSSMGADFRDYDNDGRPDLVVSALEGETFPLFRNAGKGYFTDEGLNVVTALDEIAQLRDAEISTVALAWLLAHPSVTAPIASASKISQLPALLAAPNLTLTADEVARLTEVSDKIQ